MPASPPAVDQVGADDRPPVRRRRRRPHLTDLLVLVVVVVLVGGFAGARRFGLAPRQPTVATPTTATPATTPAAPTTAAGPATTGTTAGTRNGATATTATTPSAPAASPVASTSAPAPALAPATTAAPATTLPPADVPFAVRPPDAARPVRVLVVGDALAGGLGRALGQLGAADGGLSVRTQAVATSGLARPDVYDWPSRIASTVVPDDELVVVFLGLNDAQALSRTDADTGRVGSTAWTTRYRERLAALIDGVGPRPVLLVGLPAVENPTRDRELEPVRAALYAEAAAHANVRYLDLNAQVSDGGRFLRYLDGGNGTELVARSNDGEQFTDAGNGFVALAVVAAVWPPLPGAGAPPEQG